MTVHEALKMKRKEMEEALAEPMTSVSKPTLQRVLKESTELRITHCEQSLIQILRSNKYEIADCGIENKELYLRFSLRAYKTLLGIADKIKKNDYEFTAEELVQITKAVCQHGCTHKYANIIVDELVVELLKERS